MEKMTPKFLISSLVTSGSSNWQNNKKSQNQNNLALLFSCLFSTSHLRVL